MIAIGGPLDGEWLAEQDDREVVVFPIPQKEMMVAQAYEQELVWRTAVYHVQQIRTEGCIFKFYAHESLTPVGAIRKLIEGYKP